MWLSAGFARELMLRPCLLLSVTHLEVTQGFLHSHLQPGRQAGCTIFTLQVRRLTGHLFTQGHNHRCHLALSSGPFPSGDGCAHHTISTMAGLERTNSTVCWVSVISESPWPGASFKIKCHQQGNYHYRCI